jgi:short-subunit dehydrogenase
MSVIAMPLKVVITGASSGIGEALAVCFASKGHALGLAARSVDKLETLAQRLRDDYAVQVETIALDVQDLASIPAVLQTLISRLDGMDILVANAGITGIRRSGRDPLSLDLAVFQTNLFGAIATLDVATTYFLTQGHGHLVGMSSFSAFTPIPGSAAYSASKAALSNYMNAMRLELMDKHIDVTVIHPGFINTHIAPKMDKYPFVINADVAAREMVAAIERKQVNVIVPALPWRLAKGVLQHMPDSLMGYMVQRLMKKQNPKKAH